MQPEALFDELESETARRRLACCNLKGSMVKSRDDFGRDAYASASGDTSFWKRNPQQLEATLACMLCKGGGRMHRLRQYEADRLRECMAWLNENNPHVRVLFAHFERFKRGRWRSSGADKHLDRKTPSLSSSIRRSCLAFGAAFICLNKQLAKHCSG